MKKIILLLWLSLLCVQAQAQQCPPKVDGSTIKPEMASLSQDIQTKRLGGVCSASVVPPAVINGVSVTDSFTGDVGFYPFEFSSCSGAVTTPANSRHLGANGPYVYTMTFSQPVNNVVMALTGSGYTDAEQFIVTTNGGIPSIGVTFACYTTIDGNIIYSGEGSVPDGSNGGGGIFTVTAPSDYTTLTISGPGGVAGSLLSICENSITPITCNVGFAPILTATSLTSVCPSTTVNLNPITATNPPIFTGVTLTWHTASPATAANQLTTAQAAQVPAGAAYYAAFYDSVNDCYSPTAPVTTTLSPPIVPLFTQIGPHCSGENIPALPTTSNNNFAGVWTPAINNTATTTYTFTPSAAICVTTATMTVIINPLVTPVFEQVDPICNGANLDALPTVSNNGITGNWSPAINNSATTTYVFTPNVSAQCGLNTSMEIVVLQNPDVAIQSGCQGSDFVLTAISQTSNLTYEWLDDSGASISAAQSVKIPAVGNYTVIVNDGNCESQESITVNSIYCDIPKGISPNNDGLNDFFDLSYFDVKKLQIFNRYGVVVYEKDNYEKEWNGTTDKGKELPDSTYYYLIRFENGESKTGWVYVNREH
jgi:gliding motility-associated-like protein